MLNRNYWESKRIRLRALETTDAPHFFAWNQDSEMGLMVDRLWPPASQKSVEEWLERVSAKADDDSDDNHFVIETLTGEFVGLINPHKCDRRVGDFSYGIAIRREHQRQGYAREAIVLLLRYFFSELRYQKVTIKVFEYNEASRILHERLGFVKEGQIRRAQFHNGRFWDDLIYGMTKEEFETTYQ